MLYHKYHRNWGPQLHKSYLSYLSSRFDIASFCCVRGILMLAGYAPFFNDFFKRENCLTQNDESGTSKNHQ